MSCGEVKKKILILTKSTKQRQGFNIQLYLSLIILRDEIKQKPENHTWVQM
jgi:hypothetical protein